VRSGNLNFIGGNRNKHVYVNILREYLKARAEKLGIPENVAFYRDDDPQILHV
jgi:hypothetical protein